MDKKMDRITGDPSDTKLHQSEDRAGITLFCNKDVAAASSF
jgi:hypothetical protein